MKNSLRSGFMKLLSAVVVMLMLFTVSELEAQTTTIFQSGFETTDPAFIYSAPATGQGSNMVFFGDTTLFPRTGTHHGRAVGGTGTTSRIQGSIITPQITFDPGYTYTVEVYARVDDPTQPVTMEIRRAATPTHAAISTGTIILNAVNVSSTSYTLFSGTTTVPSSTTQHVGIVVARNVNGGAINIDDVVITRTCIPSSSTAGSNISTCGTSAGLAATLAPWETGTWSVISGSGTFSNANNPNATVSGLAVGANVFQWTVTHAACNVATSTVTVTRQTAPSITSQPSSQTVCLGDTVTFSVTATGSNLTYQWRKDGVNISGATNSTLILNNVTAGSAGAYSVVVSGSCPPSVTSTNAVLTVNTPPSITTQPGGQTICSGETLNMNVTATGASTYQWRRNGTNLINGGNVSGATSASLTITNAGTGAAGTYDVVVTSAQGCSAVSSGASVTVNQSPEVTANPGGQVVCEGTNVSFSVTALGAGLNYQWRKNGSNLSNGGNISGATTSTLMISNVNVSDIGNYDVIVSNSQCPSDTSASAGLIVQLEPVIQAHPVNTTGCDGGSVSLSAVATGSGIDYQWRKNGVDLSNGGNISGANSANLVIDPFSASDTGTYDVVISGNCGAPLTSNAATVSLGTVVNPSVTITASDNPACDSITVFFAATPIDGGPLPVYQWYLNNNPVGNNNDSLALLGLQTGDEIYVEMTSSADCPVPAMVTSNTITMTVNPLSASCIPVISLLPQYCPFVQTNITNEVEAERVYDATAYEFRVENAALSFSASLIRESSSTCCPYIFAMNMINGLKFNTTYEVSVRARVGGVWGNYGPACDVTTPPLPQLSLQPASCNVTIPNLFTLLYSQTAYNVSNFRYQISGPGGFNAIYVRGSGSNAFSLSWVPGIQYNTTYDVRVEAFINGDWTGYGPICQVTTPAQIPTTQLNSASCNITLSSMNQILSADPVANATNYRYRITRPGFTAIYTRNSSSSLFSMGWVNGIQFGETYNVEVAAMVGGVWASYGTVCSVTTPSTLPTTQLASGSCNITLNNLNDLLFSNPVANASDYQYRVINTTLGYNQIYQRGSGSNSFSMAWLSGINYNTTYTVEVRANVGGIWGSFGPSCDITTPANIPTTQLASQWCNTTLTSMSQIVSVDPVPNATNYEYHIYNTTLGFNTTLQRGSSSSLFSLSWVPGIQLDETYNIEVRAMVGGVWGNYGPVCTLTTPPTPASSSKIFSQSEKNEVLKNLTIYPNPATTHVSVEYMAEENITSIIRVFDLSGRVVIESLIHSSSGSNLVKLDVESLQKGVYLVEITSGDSSMHKKLIIQ